MRLINTLDMSVVLLFKTYTVHNKCLLNSILKLYVNNIHGLKEVIQ